MYRTDKQGNAIDESGKVIMDDEEIAERMAGTYKPKKTKTTGDSRMISSNNVFGGLLTGAGISADAQLVSNLGYKSKSELKKARIKAKKVKMGKF